MPKSIISTGARVTENWQSVTDNWKWSSLGSELTTFIDGILSKLLFQWVEKRFNIHQFFIWSKIILKATFWNLYIFVTFVEFATWENKRRNFPTPKFLWFGICVIVHISRKTFHYFFFIRIFCNLWSYCIFTYSHVTFIGNFFVISCLILLKYSTKCNFLVSFFCRVYIITGIILEAKGSVRKMQKKGTLSLQKS